MRGCNHTTRRLVASKPGTKIVYCETCKAITEEVDTSVTMPDVITDYVDIYLEDGQAITYSMDFSDVAQLVMGLLELPKEIREQVVKMQFTLYANSGVKESVSE